MWHPKNFNSTCKVQTCHDSFDIGLTLSLPQLFWGVWVIRFCSHLEICLGARNGKHKRVQQKHLNACLLEWESRWRCWSQRKTNPCSGYRYPRSRKSLSEILIKLAWVERILSTGFISSQRLRVSWPNCPSCLAWRSTEYQYLEDSYSLVDTNPLSWVRMPFISKLLESSTFHRACFDGPAKWWFPLLYYTRQLYYTCVMTLPPSAMIECLPKRIYFKHLSLYPCHLVVGFCSLKHVAVLSWFEMIVRYTNTVN